tara:strand:- start:686 stop:1483 length:798 start_codon:yes stop_codon:yes gene_type:complete
MTHYTFTKTTAEQTAAMQQTFWSQATAPLDGMWLSFASMADHYAISHGDTVIGYCAINSEQKLLQFFVVPGHDTGVIFEVLIKEVNVTGAVVSTAEPHYLSLCLDKQTSLSVNALMYHVLDDSTTEPATFPEGSDFKPVTSDQLETAVEFAHQALGADKGWLTGYYTERIAGEELIGLWQGDTLIAAGECRPCKEQPKYADVGMVVSPDYRTKGLATNILRELILMSHRKGLKPICSTEQGNIAAQKSITRAGFVSQHRILDIAF